MTRPSRILSAPTLGRALAEVAIIVVGVLIALGADAWWTEREERASLREYITRLAEDLDADRGNLESVANREEWRAVVADRLIDRMQNPIAPPKDTLRTMLNQTRGGGFGPLRTGTWQDLSSTGRLALIEDPELRLWLLRYYDSFVPGHNDYLAVYDELLEALVEEMLPHLDDRAVYGHLRDDPDVPVLTTSWDAFRGDPRVLMRLRAVSATAVDEARWRRRGVRGTVDCFRLALLDAGASWEIEAEPLSEVRERCQPSEP